MRVSNIIGLLLGMAFTAVGLFCTILIFGCGLSFFPVLLPPDLSSENPLCFDCAACAMDGTGLLWLFGYLIAVFMISGAVASRIGVQRSPSRGAVAVALVFGGLLFHSAASAQGVDMNRTILLGVSAVLGAVACAY